MTFASSCLPGTRLISRNSSSQHRRVPKARPYLRGPDQPDAFAQLGCPQLRGRSYNLESLKRTQCKQPITRASSMRKGLKSGQDAEQNNEKKRRSLMSGLRLNGRALRLGEDIVSRKRPCFG